MLGEHIQANPPPLTGFHIDSPFYIPPSLSLGQGFSGSKPIRDPAEQSIGGILRDGHSCFILLDRRISMAEASRSLPLVLFPLVASSCSVPSPHQIVPPQRFLSASLPHHLSSLELDLVLLTALPFILGPSIALAIFLACSLSC